jgi:hypothetical protein
MIVNEFAKIVVALSFCFDFRVCIVFSWLRAPVLLAGEKKAS